MLRDAAVTLILNRSGQRGGASGPVDTTLQAQVVLEMQQAQQELETGSQAGLAWFLENDYTNAAFKTVLGNPLVAWPTGFLREMDEERVTLFYQDATQDDTWVPIPKVDYDEGKTKLGGSVPGAPQAYTVVGTAYRFWPTPDAEYLLNALVYTADAVLDSNIENKWLKYAHRLLIGKTGVVVAGVLLRDDVALQHFQAMATEGADALTRDNVARKEAGRSRSQGED